MLTILDRLSAHLQGSKKTDTHHDCFFIICGMLVNLKGLRFRTQSSKSCNIFPNSTDREYIH